MSSDNVNGATGASGPQPLVIRPRRIRIVAWTIAVLAVVLFALVATALRGTTDGGGTFAAGDQFAMVGLGFVLGGGVLLFTRPRVIADGHGIAVRNVIGAVELPWQVVRAITFDDRSPWASLELHDDEQVAVMAIQLADKEHAVVAAKALRAMMAAATENHSVS